MTLLCDMEKNKWTPEQIKAWQNIKKKGVRTYQENLKNRNKERKEILKAANGSIKKNMERDRIIKASHPNKQTPIKRRTKKRAADERKYNARVAELKSDENNHCQANLEGCTGEYSENHHMDGRIGDLLLDESKWLFLCMNCHRIIERKPEMAKEKGFSNYRLKKIK